MSGSSLHDDPTLLVHAYLDGELDPVNALAFERRLTDDPALAAEYARIEALQRLIRERLPREAAPRDLRARIEAAVRPQRVRPTWQALAASILVTACVTSGAMFMALAPRTPDTVETAMVAGHIRALMAPQVADVASSDRHTVKPWFNGRIPQAPRVIDLAKQDFPLAGGRIDVVGRTPVPTLVYRHAKHVISLTQVPAADHPDVAPATDVVDGYNVVRWTEGGVTYWAISDMAAADLRKFAQAFRTTPPDQ